MDSIYGFTVKDYQGKDVSLADYRFKVLLIVNTATKCGFTPQYEGLQALYRKYKDLGLVILDFPCNQFLHQAPQDDQGICEFRKNHYQADFPQFQKIKVNGKDAAPLYVYLKAKQPGSSKSGRIQWNFTKFLVDRQGNVVARYAPNVAPDAIEKDLKPLLLAR